MSDKITRVPLDELDVFGDTGEVLVKANEALVLHEFRRMLERQAERDMVIEDMRGIIDTLATGHVMAVSEIKKLKQSHAVLVRQQSELHERQNIIAAVCDVFAKKLEDDASARTALVSGKQE
jgi:hypothetical protein